MSRNFSKYWFYVKPKNSLGAPRELTRAAAMRLAIRDDIEEVHMLPNYKQKC